MNRIGAKKPRIIPAIVPTAAECSKLGIDRALGAGLVGGPVSVAETPLLDFVSLLVHTAICGK